MATAPITLRTLVVLLAVLAVSVLPLNPAEAATPVGFVGASDSAQLAIEVSQQRFGDAEATHAVLARNDDVADALAASALLGDAPLLVTPSDHVPANVVTELTRVLPDGGTVVLAGGTAALGPGVESAVESAGLRPWRIAGRDRVATAAALATAVLQNTVPRSASADGTTHEAQGPADRTSAMLAVGWARPDDPTGSSGWADAISGGAVAAGKNMPILLTSPTRLSPVTAQVIADLGIDRIVVLGGPGAVANAVLDPLHVSGVEVVRADGSDRQATGWNLAQMIWGSQVGSVTAVPGWDDQGWIAGLAAAGLASDRGQPLVLARPDGDLGGCTDATFVGAWAEIPAYGVRAHLDHACGRGPAPLAPGTFEIAARAPDGHPASWCGTFPVAANFAGAPAGARAALDNTVLQIERATGLHVTVVSTTERATDPQDRPLGWTDDDGQGRPVLLSWPAQWNENGVVGWGTWVSRGYSIISGSVALDASVTEPQQLESLMLHEFGHVLGLGHVEDTSEVMGPPSYPSQTTWGPGERYALAELASWCG